MVVVVVVVLLLLLLLLPVGGTISFVLVMDSSFVHNSSVHAGAQIDQRVLIQSGGRPARWGSNNLLPV